MIFGLEILVGGLTIGPVLTANHSASRVIDPAGAGAFKVVIYTRGDVSWSNLGI